MRGVRKGTHGREYRESRAQLEQAPLASQLAKDPRRAGRKDAVRLRLHRLHPNREGPKDRLTPFGRDVSRFCGPSSDGPFAFIFGGGVDGGRERD